MKDRIQRGSKYENINLSKLERKTCTAHMEGFGGGGEGTGRGGGGNPLPGRNMKGMKTEFY